jgi:hypothetical protein
VRPCTNVAPRLEADETPAHHELKDHGPIDACKIVFNWGDDGNEDGNDRAPSGDGSPVSWNVMSSGSESTFDGIVIGTELFRCGICHSCRRT